MNKKGAYTTTKKNSAKGISIFEEVMNATPDVTGKYQKGLAAAGLLPKRKCKLPVQ